jgi:mannitol-1-phosphate 5-dehydrogenase
VGGKAVFVGAGKIGRGFLAHLAFRSGYGLTFIDANRDLVDLLIQRRAYRLHILGAPSKDETISGFNAFHVHSPEVTEVGLDADVIFVSVGGPNLGLAGMVVSRMVAGRTRNLNVIVGENWPHAAAELKKAANLPAGIGVAEATILRSCIEPTEAQRAQDPLSVQCQDYWELPVDAEALLEPVPQIEGLKPTPSFENALQRKVYTYNAINATIAYLGYHLGHKLLSEAANDPAILAHALGVRREVDEAICRRFGYAPEAQLRYSDSALAKFQNALIVDPIERQVRDPLRKLGRHDRLVGAAMLAMEVEVPPRELALSIAAALQYRNPSDASAVRLHELVDDLGPAEALARIAQIDRTSRLVQLVMERYDDVGRLIATAASR